MVLGAGCLKVGGAGGAVEEEGGEGGFGVARDEDSLASGATTDSTTLGSTPSEINDPGGPITTSDGPDGPNFSTPQDSAVGVLRPVPEQYLRISLTRVQSPLRTLQHPAPQLVFLHPKGTTPWIPHQMYKSL
ncbi:hypothetical protein Taro_014898 [Colocasia esculenta]|uniref:Uncharacterized protein n=1 Tax=Colocasia esculenta TaxID=4460 RepID=A0A843UNA1_COLES|nr:hypothetical protein [Colocasia esculenta]